MMPAPGSDWRVPKGSPEAVFPFVLLSVAMRAAAIFNPGCPPKNLDSFQKNSTVEWLDQMPSSRDQADLILIFGGDGTVHHHLSQLVELALPVLVVPVGSGNDFACALGIRNLKDAYAAWNRFRDGGNNVRTADLGVITPLSADGKQGTSRYFASVAGVGIDGEVARRANKLPRWLRGNGGYLLTLIPTILRFTPRHLQIFVSEKGSWTLRSDRRVVLAAFANTATYGGGMKIAPQAHPNDGLLDICIVGPVGKIKLLSLFPSVYTGEHLKVREVSYFQAPGARVESDQPLAIYADGEYVCQTPAEISLSRSALPVITR